MSIFNRYLQKFNWTKKEQSRSLVIITGYYGFDNLGDEAILEELLLELNGLCPRQNIVVLSHNPQKTSSLYQIHSINRWHWLAYINMLRRAKLLISGGGGLFQDRTGLGSVIFYSAQIFLARLCGAQVLIYAQGLGPLQRMFSRKITQLAFQQASMVTLRDHNSIAMAKDWGVECQLTADSVWTLPPSPLPKFALNSMELLRSQLSGQNSMIVGISLRDDLKLHDDHLQLLAKILNSVLPAQSVLVLLPLQSGRDNPLLWQFKNYVSSSGLKTIFSGPLPLERPSKWLALMEHLDLVIGMRLHALLMALKAGKPVIGITYDAKVSFLLEQFEQPALSLDYKNMQECEAAWFKTISQAIEQKKEFTSRVQKNLATVSQLASKNIDALAKVLRKNK